MSHNADELKQKLHDTQQLLEAMLLELRFRGLEDDHRLIRQARDLCDWYQQHLGWQTVDHIDREAIDSDNDIHTRLADGSTGCSGIVGFPLHGHCRRASGR